MSEDRIIEIGARALHRVDCAEADEDERRAGREPPPKWADPWDPSGCGVNQQQLLRTRFKALRAAFSEAGLAIVPVEALDDLKQALTDFIEREVMTSHFDEPERLGRVIYARKALTAAKES